MISLIQKGKYSLLQTREKLLFLVLEKKIFSWVKSKEDVVLSLTTKRRSFDVSILQSGNYRIYCIYDEKDFTNGTYLELFVGGGEWECYHLSDGLPSKKKPSIFIHKLNNTITKITHLVTILED